MIARLLIQTLLATSVFQLFPYDAAVIERAATLPAAGDRIQVGVFEAFDAARSSSLPIVSAEAPVKVRPTSVGAVTSAESAIVIDRQSGVVLFEKNAQAPRSIGSITKIMTAHVFLEDHPDLDAPAQILSEDIRYGGVQHVGFGDEVRVRDLLRASLIASDNSATAALVRLSGRSLGDFVARMNEKGAAMGLENTTFVDPTGLSAENRSVVNDIAILLDRALQNETIREATHTISDSFVGASGRRYTLTNTNELLSSYLNAPPYAIIGGKTGFLPEAGYCLGTIFSNEDGHEITVVVLGSQTPFGRFQDVKALGAWTYQSYQWR